MSISKDIIKQCLINKQSLSARAVWVYGFRQEHRALFCTFSW